MAPPSVHLNNQVVQHINAKAIARRQNRCRTVFRDDRRAGEGIARDQRRPIVYRRVMGFAVEEHRSMASDRLLSVALLSVTLLSVTIDDWLPARIERLAAGNHAHANVHYFHLVLVLCEPVTKPV